MINKIAMAITHALQGIRDGEMWCCSAVPVPPESATN